MLEETFLQSYLKNYVQVHLDKSCFKRKVLLDLVCLLFFFQHLFEIEIFCNVINVFTAVSLGNTLLC